MSDTTPTPTADDIRAKAAQTANDGLQGYTHGSRTVNRSNPNEMMEAADRMERTAARKKRGLCSRVCNTVGVP